MINSFKKSGVLIFFVLFWFCDIFSQEVEEGIFSFFNLELTFGAKLNYAIISERNNLYKSHRYHNLDVIDTSLKPAAYKLDDNFLFRGVYFHNYNFGLKTSYLNLTLNLQTSFLNPFSIKDNLYFNDTLKGSDVNIDLLSLGAKLTFPVYKNFEAIAEFSYDFNNYEAKGNDIFYYVTFERLSHSSNLNLGISYFLSLSEILTFSNSVSYSLFNSFYEYYNVSDTLSWIIGSQLYIQPTARSGSVRKKNFFSLKYETSLIYDYNGLKFILSYMYQHKDVKPYLRQSIHIIGLGINF